SGSTSQGNLTTSITLHGTEGGYYVAANASKQGYENESSESVFVADDNKTVLIVADDDAGDADYNDTNFQEFRDAIVAISGLDISVQNWSIAVNGSVLKGNMTSADLVIWTAGDKMNGGLLNTSSEISNISDYLEEGGAFILESAALAHEVYNSRSLESMLALMRTRNVSSEPQLSGSLDIEKEPGYYKHMVSKGYGGKLSANITVSGSLYKDRILPNSTANGTSLMRWEDYKEYSSAVSFDERSDNGTNGSKTLYIPYSIDGISAAERNKLIQNIFMWGVKTRLGVFVRPNDTQYYWNSTSPGNVRLSIYVKDHDAENVTGLTNGSSINCTLIYPNGTSSPLTVTASGSNYEAEFQTNQEGQYEVKVNASRIGNYYGFGKANITVNLSTPPPAPVWFNLTLTGAINRQNVTLRWNTQERTEYYDIYASTDMGSTFTRMDNTSTPSYENSNASNYTQLFYKVASVNEWGTNITTVVTGKLDYEFQRKPNAPYNTTKNWFALPLNSTYLHKAQQLIGGMENVTTITLWNATIQRGVTCNTATCPEVCTSTTCNFPLKDAEGYELNVNSSTYQRVNWTLAGTVVSPVKINLTKNSTSFGKNWAGMWANTSLATASQLLNNVSNADAVTNWNAATQKPEGWIDIWGGIGTNFGILITKGYEVSVTESGNWTQN
ncbi:MAG: hypothetical protein ABIB71_08695, partial [Candidatus Woesearchaeota archaeon]